jgi:hypothetical protein
MSSFDFVLVWARARVLHATTQALQQGAPLTILSPRVRALHAKS